VTFITPCQASSTLVYPLATQQAKRVKMIDNDYRYVLMVLVAYAWAMMPLLFLLSFCFKEATGAFVWVTVINILSSTSNYTEELQNFNVLCIIQIEQIMRS